MKIKLLSNYKQLFKDKPENRYFLLTGGRGSGKSFHVSLFLLNLTYQKNHVILFTRWTMTSAHISILPEFLEKIEMLNVEDDFTILQKEIINKKTGSRIIFRGIKTSQGTATANLKSIQGVTTWVLDEAEELVEEGIFDKIDLSIRAKEMTNRVILIMNPSYKTHFIYNRFVSKNNNCTHIHTTYLDNIKNLNESFIEQAELTKNENQLRYNHLFLGEWLDDAEGLLWNKNIIDRSRIKTSPEIVKKVIAIDPATTSNSKSDETGIVIVGKDVHNKIYVLDDLSGKYSPNEWGELVSKAFKNNNCDYYAAEKNQGGDMVKAMIRQYDTHNHIKLVQATKGKYLRAEPVYAQYEQSNVYHVGNFPILERQMLTFNPDENKQSPDRVDALVYGITELMESNNTLEDFISIDY